MFSLRSLFIISFVPFAIALPNPDPDFKNPAPFEVTNLFTFEPTNRHSFFYIVSFGVSDPSDGSSTNCSTYWPYAKAYTGYPSSYLANCTDSSYAFKFVNYKTYMDFKLDVEHSL
ncbi:hypothetical protein GQ44DRAFT_470530 [Phaeosphaeriaceae sp. PMI808]|nr:hypothetical protein GQ44DRAFT_470530 [Phaeosphaeriaceae sp. PMI808]